MNRRSAARTASLAALAVTFIAISIARGTVPADSAPSTLGLAPASELWIAGTSTLHDWECRTRALTAGFTRATRQADPSGGAGIEAFVRAQGVRGVELQIPVTSLHSDSKGLDKNMCKALRAGTYPTIRFRMDRYTVVSPAHADTLQVQIEGALTVSGTERHITLESIARAGDQGEWIDGTEPLLMSDFGIKPPTMMLGRIKVADRVVIHYHLLLASDTGVPGAKLHPSR